MNTKHLKAKILDLAIRGKLVPQDSSEGNAVDLLQKIRDEKGGESLPLAAAGKPSSATPSAGSNAARNARSKNASFIIKADDGRHYEQFADGSLKDIEDEIPFEIPANWCWCRLKEITTLLGDGLHGSPKYDKNGDYYFINGNNLENGVIRFKSDTKKVSFDEFNKYKKNLNEYTVLVSINGTLGNIAFYNNEKIILGKSACYFNLISSDFKSFIYWLIKTEYFLNYANTEATGSTIKNVSLDAMRNFFIPLPPLSEQKRIVSAIEKAFEQIDIIEKNKLNLKTYIKQTKSKVLDLAIHGKLVEQNPQEGNAFELLEKIRSGKIELIKQKKIKEDKNASFIIKADDGRHYEQFADGSLKDVEDEIPFQIPENWCWCRLGVIGTWQAGCTPDRSRKDFYTNATIPWLCSGDLTDGYIEQIPNAVSEIAFNERKMKLNKAGSVCIAMYGATIGKLGILTQDATTNQAVCVCNNLQATETKYLFYFLRTHKKEYIEAGFGGAQPNISKEKIEPTLFPLPPLSEQKRIVAKIEQVFEQLDILEKSLGE